MRYNLVTKYLLLVAFLASFATSASFASKAMIPAEKFDLRYWRLTLPADANGDGDVDSVSAKKLRRFSHPDFFYLDKNKGLVFVAPNKAATTANSSNTRSELRQMKRGKKTKIGTKTPRNNFALRANAKAKKFGSIGGTLEATLKVNHVALRAKHSKKQPAFSVVVGQIHAGKDYLLSKEGEGYGNGNEPLKIFYKKWPQHKNGSVFWTYERNLVRGDKNRIDVAYPIWGNTWEKKKDPGDSGVALGEQFSYSVNVHLNTMYLRFSTARHKTVEYQIDLSNNVDAYGNVDTKDHNFGYSGDWFYFKAGAYNQCSTKGDKAGFWSTGCAGTGDWKTDFAKGDYASVTFSKIRLGRSKKPKGSGKR